MTTALRRPHAGGPVLAAGAPAATAHGAVLLVHGRGGSAEQMLELGRALGRDDLALRAPQADAGTWYPLPFMAPLEANEPYLTAALERLGEVADELAAAGLPRERTLIVGFSQGACLALEHVSRSNRRWGAVAGLAGGLIGPDGTPRDAALSLAGTPVFLGCGVPDPHIPQARVEASAAHLRAIGGRVTLRLYPGLGHGINADELQAVRELAAGL